MSAVEEAVMFDAWGGGIRDLSERGFINGVVSEKKIYRMSPDFTPLPEDDAMLRMAERYFGNYAPATVRDAAYYFGIPQTRVKKLLDKLPVESAGCGGRTYFYIEGGKKYMSGIPDCVFLAGFDGLMLGYEKKENVFLPPEHLRGIFNLAGIVMPARAPSRRGCRKMAEEGREAHHDAIPDALGGRDKNNKGFRRKSVG